MFIKSGIKPPLSNSVVKKRTLHFSIQLYSLEIDVLFLVVSFKSIIYILHSIKFRNYMFVWSVTIAHSSGL